MKTELLYLSYVTILTGVLWIPYILDRMLTCGLLAAVGYPDNSKPQSQWAVRLMKAHSNAVENLVVFATLILLANAMNISNSVIANASMLYFAARVVHAVCYTLGAYAGFFNWCGSTGHGCRAIAVALVRRDGTP